MGQFSNTSQEKTDAVMGVSQSRYTQKAHKAASTKAAVAAPLAQPEEKKAVPAKESAAHAASATEDAMRPDLL